MSNPLTSVITKYLESKYNAYVINLIQASKSGNADLLACIQGQFYCFELKYGKDTVKDLQIAKINKVILAGGKGGIVKNTDDIDNIINNPPKLLNYNVNVINL